MGVVTFLQPDFTGQTAPVYKAALDGSSSVMKRFGVSFAPHEQATPNMTVALDAGFVWDGSTLTEVAAQSTGTIVAPVTNPRIDRIVVSPVDGTVSVITGTEAPAPSAPTITGGNLPVAQVALATATTLIPNSLITDERVFPGSGGLTSIQVFTSDGTWTKPAGVTKVQAIVVGGGGGGGGAETDQGTGGGGAGGTSIMFIDVTSIASSTITRGAGGAGGSAGANNGVAGANSVWSDGMNTLTGNGGSGGTTGGNQSSGGSGGASTGGDLDINGGGGGGSAGGATGGNGGASYLGGGGASKYNAAGEAAGDYGGGGSGGSGANTTARAGGAGGNGVVIIWEYR